MKKFLALLLLCLLPLWAAAEMDEDGNVIVDLGDAEVFFTPIEGYCLTRESSASAFNQLGASQRETVLWMEECGVYALLFNQAMNAEFQLIISPTTDMDFDELTKYGLDMACESMESGYNSMGYDVEKTEMYHTFDGHSYVQTICAYGQENGNAEYMVEYFTCQSGYAVSVVLFPFEGEPTEEQILQCESMVDSLWLSKNVSNGADE